MRQRQLAWMKMAGAMALAIVLSACSLFDTPPKLPEPPAGATTLVGGEAWVTEFDVVSLDWKRDFEAPRDIAEYRLPPGSTWEAVKAHYEPAFAGWEATNDKDARRDRWFSRTWRQGSRYVALGYFVATGERDFDILVIQSKPAAK